MQRARDPVNKQPVFECYTRVILVAKLAHCCGPHRRCEYVRIPLSPFYDSLSEYQERKIKLFPVGSEVIQTGCR